MNFCLHLLFNDKLPFHFQEEFSASSPLSTNELTSADSNCFSPKESKFYKSSSDNNVYNRDRHCVEFCYEKKKTPGEITKNMTSSEISLTSNYDLPLKEVFVVPAAADVNSETKADKIQTTESDCQNISIIVSTDNAPIPVVTDNCLMNELVEASTACEPAKENLKKNIYHFFLRNHREVHVDDKDFLLP